MSVSVNVNCQEESYNIQNNMSTVYLKITITTSGTSYNNNNQTGTINYGLSGNISVNYKLPKNTTTTVYEGRQNITHNSDGSGSCSWAYSLPTTPSGGTKSDNGTISLTKIPRNFSKTPTISASNISTNSVKINWSTSENCDWIQYSLNNGKWIDTAGNPFMISGLNANTQYTVKCNMRRSDSGLFSTSNTISFTTQKYINIKNFSVFSNSLNSITFKWTTDENCSKIQYSLNNEKWTDISGSGSSGNFTINKLNYNTNYTCKIRVYKSSNGLWTESWNVSQKTLDINRVSSIKIDNYLINSNGFKINNNQKLTINCNNNSRGNIRYFIDVPAGSRRITSEITNNTSYTFTAEQIRTLLQYIPNSNSSTIRVGVDTFGDSTYYNYLDGNLEVVYSNPNFSDFEYKDINDITTNLTGNNQVFINKYSKAQIAIKSKNKMIAKNYATAKNYIISAGNKSITLNYSSDDIITTISNISTNNIVIRATDSRNNSTSVSKNIKNIAYNNVNIKKLVVNRISGVGTTLIFDLEGTYTNVNFGAKSNSIKSATLKYKNKNSSNWSNDVSILGNLKIDNGNISVVTNSLSGYIFDVGTTYNIQVTIADELSSYTVTTELNNGHPLFSAVKGKGICIGGIYNTSSNESLQVRGDASYDGKVTASGDITSSSNITAGNYIKANGFYSMDAGNAGTPVGNGSLVIKRANASEAPNNGIILEFGNSKVWTGQLYIGDNADQGIYFNGWSNGKRGSWHRLAQEDKTVNLIYPVGSIYMSVNSTSPASLFGGTWTRIAQGRTLIGEGTVDTNNDNWCGKTNANDWTAYSGHTGGEVIHQLTANELPQFKRWTGDFQSAMGDYNQMINTAVNGGNNYGMKYVNIGRNYKHNNLPPYLVVYIWKRTG